MREHTERTEKTPRRASSGWGLLAVQSISCAVVILAVLLLRLVGDGAFQELRAYFKDAMQQNALTTAIHALWDEEIYTTAPETTTTTTSTAETASTTKTAPVSGAVLTSAFGWRADPFGQGQEFHRGVDLAAPVGTPIAAMWTGEVTEVDVDGAGTLGKYLRLCHDKIEVLYAHCDTITVKAGDTVTAGEYVATVGNTGRTTGAHLHFEITQNGTAIDPAPLLCEVEDV